MSLSLSSEQIQHQICLQIASLTERGIWPPEDGEIVSLRIPIGGHKDGVLKVAKVIKKKEGEECSICLNGYKVGEEVKFMPCRHCYHSCCIDKWLGIHGSCPICRYQMPEPQIQGRDRQLVYEFVYRHRPERVMMVQ